MKQIFKFYFIINLFAISFHLSNQFLLKENNFNIVRLKNNKTNDFSSNLVKVS
jgi:hypothetical protein